MARVDGGIVWPAIRILTLAVIASHATASLASGADRLNAPGSRKGETTEITVRADPEAGDFAQQRIDILENGTVTCDGLELRGRLTQPIVKEVTLTDLDFGACIYIGMSARVNASSCHIIISGAGLGRLVSHGDTRCNLRIETPGCTIHLGKGPFLHLGYHNFRSPREVTALTEPLPIGGVAIGLLCFSTGPFAIGQYKGYLRMGGIRSGEKVPFRVIL